MFNNFFVYQTSKFFLTRWISSTLFFLFEWGWALWNPTISLCQINDKEGGGGGGDIYYMSRKCLYINSDKGISVETNVLRLRYM